MILCSALVCPCEKFVKEALGPYSGYMDKDDIAIVSVSVFGNDDETKLRNYAEEHDWRHALGDSNGDIEIDYNVIGTPKIFIIDKEGKITYSHVGPISESELSNEVDKALTGQGGVVNLKESSIYLFAVGAGVMVFFSPCSFPMLPGYMSFYLANKKQRTGKFDETAARETLPDGLAAAAGLAGVLLLIGILLIPFVSVIGGFLGHLELLIGIVFTGLGVVMVMEYDSEKIVQPFRKLVAQIGSSAPALMAKQGIEKELKPQQEKTSVSQIIQTELELVYSGMVSLTDLQLQDVWLLS